MQDRHKDRSRIKPGSGPKAERVVLTRAHISELCRLRQDSGKGPQAMLRGAFDRPPGLDARMITSWLDGKVKTADPEHLRYVLRRWQNVPERAELTRDLHPGIRRQRYRKPRIELNEERIAFLKSERTRTGVGPTRLLKDADDIPDGLSVNTLTNWLMGQNRQVRKDHFEYVLDLWACLPDA